MISENAARFENMRTPVVRTPGAGAIVLAIAVMLHGAMVAFDLRHPERFLWADRAGQRVEKIEGFERSLEQGTVLPYLGSHGILGDYLPHALLHGAGGPVLVIGAQVALFLLSLCCLLRLAAEVTGSPRWAAAAGLLYVLHPHSLVLAHQLAAEALFIPLVVISFYLYGRYFFGERGSVGWLLAGSLVLAAATLIRPVALLWPVVFAASVALVLRRSRPALWVLVPAIVPVMAWAAFVQSQTGEFSLGKSAHDHSVNLYERVRLVAETLPEPERGALMTKLLRNEDRRLGVLDYGRLSLEHPGAFAQHAVRDAAVFIGKSGIERLMIDYLGLGSTERTSVQDPHTGWRRVLEREGLLAGLRSVYDRWPVTLVSSLVGVAFQLPLMMLAAYGMWLVVRRIRSREWLAGKRVMGLALILFPLYIFAVSTAVDAMQSRHRAPAEFALFILAALSLAAIGSGRKQRPGARAVPERSMRAPSTPGKSCSPRAG